jgi:sortase A
VVNSSSSGNEPGVNPPSRPTIRPAQRRQAPSDSGTSATVTLPAVPAISRCPADARCGAGKPKPPRPRENRPTSTPTPRPSISSPSSRQPHHPHSPQLASSVARPLKRCPRFHRTLRRHSRPQPRPVPDTRPATHTRAHPSRADRLHTDKPRTATSARISLRAVARPDASADVSPWREPLGPIRGTVRTFGELCITAGLVLILFVVWQLWWTDIQANRDNEVLADELTQDWANQDPNELPDDPDEPVVADPVGKNEAFGIFYIPRFGDDYYRTVAEGVDLEPVLNRMGVGRYPNSAMPGEVGNFSIAGHRVTYGKPLNQIANLRPGDEIIVQTKDGFYTYTFRNFDIILPDAVEVLSPVPDAPEFKGKDRILTMTACNPMFSARERYVAYAELTDWTPASDGAPDNIKDSKAYDKVSKNGGA